MTSMPAGPRSPIRRSAADFGFPPKASCTACDIDGDGDVDVFASGVESGGNLLLMNEQGVLWPTRDHPLCAIEDARGALG